MQGNQNADKEEKEENSGGSTKATTVFVSTWCEGVELDLRLCN